MPFVPTARQGQMRIVSPNEAPPDPTFLAMAAALMHEQGRLFTPKAPVEIGLDTKAKAPKPDEVA